MTSADKRQGDVTVTGGGGTPASGHGAGRGGGGEASQQAVSLVMFCD